MYDDCKSLAAPLHKPIDRSDEVESAASNFALFCVEQEAQMRKWAAEEDALNASQLAFGIPTFTNEQELQTWVTSLTDHQIHLLFLWGQPQTQEEQVYRDGVFDEARALILGQN